MAEIRSTLDMVMERAARIAEETAGKSVSEKDEVKERGMRLAVTYLNNQENDLLQVLKGQPADQQMEIRSGMAQTLLRNIILPRDGVISEQSLLSLKGLQDLSGNSSDISSICSELKQILEQYAQHKEQIKQQFDESMLGQLKMSLSQQGLAVSDTMALNPTMHPQYQEEWTRVVGDLNGQYNEALDQRKQLIGQRFGL